MKKRIIRKLESLLEVISEQELVDELSKEEIEYISLLNELEKIDYDNYLLYADKYNEINKIREATIMYSRRKGGNRRII